MSTKMKVNLSLLQQAEKNVLNNARYWTDMLSICEALAKVGNNACHEYVGKKEFFDGLSLLRSAMHAEFVNAISNCFTFAGVGGEEVRKFSKERFEELFHDDPKRLKYSVMHLLEHHCQTPSSWRSIDDENFRKEAKEKIKSFKKKRK